MAESQIITLQEKAAFLAQQEQMMTQYIESLKKEVDMGKISPEIASEKAAKAHTDFAKQQQELAVDSSYLNRIGSALASPFQWVGSKIFDENTSNLKRAVYTVGATATALALGAIGYYAMQGTPTEKWYAPIQKDLKDFVTSDHPGESIFPEYYKQTNTQQFDSDMLPISETGREAATDIGKKVYSATSKKLSDLKQNMRDYSAVEARMGSRAFTDDNTETPLTSGIRGAYDWTKQQITDTSNWASAQARRPFNAVRNAVSESTMARLRPGGLSGMVMQEAPTTISPDIPDANALPTDMTTPAGSVVMDPIIGAANQSPRMTGVEASRKNMQSLTQPRVPNFP
jgi:hypothetical protein